MTTYKDIWFDAYVEALNSAEDKMPTWRAAEIANAKAEDWVGMMEDSAHLNQPGELE